MKYRLILSNIYTLSIPVTFAKYRISSTNTYKYLHMLQPQKTFTLTKSLISKEHKIFCQYIYTVLRRLTYQILWGYDSSIRVSLAPNEDRRSFYIKEKAAIFVTIYSTSFAYKRSPGFRRYSKQFFSGRPSCFH